MALSCLTLYDPMDCVVHGILQPKVLGRVDIFFSRDFSQPGEWTCVSWVSCIGQLILYYCATWEGQIWASEQIRESTCNAGDTKDIGMIPGLRTSSGGENGNPPTPVFLPEKTHEQRSLADYSSKGHKESDMTKQLSMQLNKNGISRIVKSGILM